MSVETSALTVPLEELLARTAQVSGVVKYETLAGQ